MPNITLSIPEQLYRKMKKHKEIKWSEVIRKAIADYIKRLEESKLEISTDELLKELGIAEELNEINIEKAAEYYKKMREEEWRRFTTQVF
ncbi:MAG TPA: hypothetical protein EYP30_05545 [Archaeoglobaceae archaeon]|nr:hypothetical protein [Archaeoglobaceae archaeon]